MAGHKPTRKPEDAPDRFRKQASRSGLVRWFPRFDIRGHIALRPFSLENGFFCACSLTGSPFCV